MSGPTRVLIVDDNRGDVMLIRALLEEADPTLFEIHSTGTLEAGLLAVARVRPEVVLLDLGLPDSRGLDTVSRMLEGNSQIALVVLTGLDDSQIAIDAVKMGAEDYWHKDELTSSMVVRGVRYALERHRAGHELRNAQRQLLHAQKMDAIGRLAGGVAHDFNNLLMAILGNAEMLADLSLSSEAAELVQDLLDAGRRGGELTRQLLCLSRNQVGQPELVDLAPLVESTTRMVRRIVTTDVELHLFIEPGEHLVRAVPSQLEQVLLNLAVNARDAMAGRGELTIEVNTEVRLLGGVPVSVVCLRVRDQGCGMDDVTRSQIFEPFFTTKPAGLGTGLGLATVYGVVKQARGEINVESTVGVGTCFEVLLPRATETARSSFRQTLPTQRLVPGDETVLVLDDSEGVRSFMARVLTRSGYRVFEASSGAQALEIVRDSGVIFDLLLSDIVMPGMDGPETAARILQLRPNILVLFVSGFATQDQTETARSRIRAPILAKPLGAADLTNAVRSLLDGARGRRQTEVA